MKTSSIIAVITAASFICLAQPVPLDKDSDPESGLCYAYELTTNWTTRKWVETWFLIGTNYDTVQTTSDNSAVLITKRTATNLVYDLTSVELQEGLVTSNFFIRVWHKSSERRLYLDTNVLWTTVFRSTTNHATLKSGDGNPVLQGGSLVKMKSLR